MKRLTLALLGLAIGCSQAAPAPTKEAFAPPPIQDGDFVRAEDGVFSIGGRNVRFVGANAALVHGAVTRDAAADTLAAMNTGDLRVARFWALGETDRSEDWVRASAFRTSPDSWVEESFVHLDEVLVRARAENVRLVVVLGNRWRDHGGLPQYARWAGIPPRYDNLMPAELATTLATERVRELYFAHIERIVSRTNSINGIAYADDPTILSWEIFNEASASTCAAQRALVSFLGAASARIRAHDENHLIAAGHIGYNSPQSQAFWEEIHALDWVSYADTHGYPQNLLAAESPERFADWLTHRARAARALGKPLVVGEVGIPRQWGDRDRWFEVFFARADEEGIAALMPWIVRPHEEARDDAHGIWPAGPRSAESEHLRALLAQTSKRFAVPRQEPSDAEFPLGIETIRPFVHGEWNGERFETDPWALAEGCADGEEGFALYGLDWQAPEGTLRDIRLPSDSPDADIDVHLSGVRMGRLHGGTYEPEAGAAMPPRQAGVAWLRLQAANAAGARVIRRFTAEAPGEGALSLIVR